MKINDVMTMPNYTLVYKLSLYTYYPQTRVCIAGTLEIVYGKTPWVCGVRATKMIKPLDILLIDDSVKTQDMFGFALNDLQINYSCRFARNVEQAMNLLRVRPADFIFVDVNMPGLAGFNTIKKVIATRSVTNSSVIIYTDQNESDLCKKAMKLGVLKALKKKNEIFELIQDLKNILFKNKK